MISLWASIVLAASSQAAESRKNWLSPDFFVEQVAVDQSGVPQSADCRAAIEAKICWNEADAPKQAACLPGGGRRYAPAFDALYVSLPPALQQVFCDLKTIYVHKRLGSSAYAGHGKGGYILGVRASIIDEGLTLSQWATWKEQLPFGGDPSSYSPRPDLPMIDASVPSVSNDALFFIIAHEFGHIIDFQRRLNGFCADGSCPLGPWTRISWISGRSTRYDARFPARLKLDFYGSGPKLTKADVEPAYAQLASTDFISLYASTNYYDDFAETLAYYLLSKRGGGYRLHPGESGVASVDVTRRFSEPIFQAKVTFIDALLDDSQPRAIAAFFESPGRSLDVSWDR